MGNRLGIKTGAVLSRMDAPIGRCVGNALEVYEALECLKGRGPDDLKNLVTSLGKEDLLIVQNMFCSPLQSPTVLRQEAEREVHTLFSVNHGH